MGAAPEFPERKQGVQLPACWEVSWQKWGAERHLSAKGSAEKVFLEEGEEGKDRRKGVKQLFIYFLHVCARLLHLRLCKRKAEAI